MAPISWAHDNWLVILLLASGAASAQSSSAPASDTDESAYAPATLAKIMGGAPRSQNDEAELAGLTQWYFTTANYTGHKRTLSGVRPSSAPGSAAMASTHR